MKILKKNNLLLLTLITAISPLFAHRIPRLTIALVIDQFSYAKLMELRPYLKGGIHTILEHGVQYHNAYQLQGMPATAPGHSAISTGTYAQTHGITGNTWYNNNNQKIACDDDTVQSAAVFAPNGMHNYGKSAQNLLVDTITDQFILASKPYAKHSAYSISHKSRSAIFTAGKLGKPIWFDSQTGWFTSSKAYFEKLPHWLIRFNKTKQIDMLNSVTWNRAYTARDYPYRMFNHIPNALNLFGKTIPIDHTQEEPYQYFLQSPASINLIFELARVCIDEHLSKNTNDKMLLWLCPSTLDRAGHEFGQDSLQITDLIYHIDLELFRFYNYITKHIRKKDVLIILTADHGMGHRPELMHERGYFSAQRILSNTLQDQLNALIIKQFGLSKMVIGIKAPNIFFDTKQFKALSKEQRMLLLNTCKEFLITQPGIKRVWTYKELLRQSYEPASITMNYKHQAYPGRFGQLIIQPKPFCFLTQDTTGSAHRSPYDYDTHVPLIIYQCGSHERTAIYDHVACMQCAPTLAYLLGIPKPSACTHPLLPGIVPTNNPCF